MSWILVDAAPHSPDTKPTPSTNATYKSPTKPPGQTLCSPRQDQSLSLWLEDSSVTCWASTGTAGPQKRFLALTFPKDLMAELWIVGIYDMTWAILSHTLSWRFYSKILVFSWKIFSSLSLSRPSLDNPNPVNSLYQMLTILKNLELSSWYDRNSRQGWERNLRCGI